MEQGRKGKDIKSKQHLKKKYIYRFNPHTLAYEKVEATLGDRLKRISTTVLLGVVLGVLFALVAYYFIDSPKERMLKADIAQYKRAMNELNKSVSRCNAVLADIEERDKRIQALQNENDELKGSLGDLAGNSGMAERYDHLAEAALNYIKDPEDVTGTEAMLERIPVETVSANSLSLSMNSASELDPSIYSEAFRSLYSYIDKDVSSRAARTYIESGRNEFENKQYQSAIADLTKATEIAPMSDEAWFYLAESYKDSGDSIHATQAYSRIVNQMPDSEYAERARDNLTNGAATDNAGNDTNEAAPADNAAGAVENAGQDAAVDDAAAAQQAMVMQAIQEAAAGAAEAE